MFPRLSPTAFRPLRDTRLLSFPGMPEPHRCSTRSFFLAACICCRRRTWKLSVTLPHPPHIPSPSSRYMPSHCNTPRYSSIDRRYWRRNTSCPHPSNLHDKAPAAPRHIRHQRSRHPWAAGGIEHRYSADYPGNTRLFSRSYTALRTRSIQSSACMSCLVSLTCNTYPSKTVTMRPPTMVLMSPVWNYSPTPNCRIMPGYLPVPNYWPVSGYLPTSNCRIMPGYLQVSSCSTADIRGDTSAGGERHVRNSWV